MDSTLSQNNLYFKSGLTSNVFYQFSKSNLNNVTSYFKNQNISVDFKHNNAIAFCCLNAYNILQSIQHFGLHLFKPNQIIVEDFNNLKGNLNDSWGGM